MIVFSETKVLKPAVLALIICQSLTLKYSTQKQLNFNLIPLPVLPGRRILPNSPKLLRELIKGSTQIHVIH